MLENIKYRFRLWMVHTKLCQKVKVKLILFSNLCFLQNNLKKNFNSIPNKQFESKELSIVLFCKSLLTKHIINRYYKYNAKIYQKVFNSIINTFTPTVYMPSYFFLAQTELKFSIEKLFLIDIKIEQWMQNKLRSLHLFVTVQIINTKSNWR
jgi:hypothetical protein